MRSARQGFEFFGGLLPKFQAFDITGLLVGEFLTTRLDREVLLSKSDLRLTWIAVLCHQVAGKAGQLEICNLAVTSGA